jgi:anti-sigma factor RsiW
MKDRTDAMTTPELTCQELVELVTDYLEDALPSHERLRFEDHLAGCAGCRRYLEQMRLTVTTLGRLCEDDLSSAARDDLLAAFRTWKRNRTGA